MNATLLILRMVGLGLAAHGAQKGVWLVRRRRHQRNRRLLSEHRIPGRVVDLPELRRRHDDLLRA